MNKRKKKRMLLIAPPVTLTKDRLNFNVSFPMGLGYIAAILEGNGYDPIVLDTIIEKLEQESPVPNKPDLIQVGMTLNEIREFVIKACPDFVGITSMFSVQAYNAYNVAAVIKSIDCHIPVIFGGAHATSEPEEVLKDENINFVVLGEGENAILPLLEAIETEGDFDILESIAYRNNKGAIIVKSKTTFVDIDSLPFPARHLFPIEKYFSAGERHGLSKKHKFRSIALLSSRGCPYHCNFCSAYQMFGRKFRYRTSESVLQEIDELIETYKIVDIYLNDDQFLANPKRALEIFDGIIARNYNITLDVPNGISPWMLNEEVIQKMKQAGFWRMLLAIESGNQWVLDNIIRKPVRLNDLPTIVKLLRKYEIMVEAFLVVGNVSEEGIETFSQMRDSFDLMRNLGIRRFDVSFLSPHAGTEMFKVVQKKGYLKGDYIDDHYSKPRISTPFWSKEDLEKFATCERYICRINNQLIYWILRVFLINSGEIVINRRYHILYNLFTLVRREIVRLRRIKRGVKLWLV